MLTLDRVSKHFGGLTVLQDVILRRARTARLRPDRPERRRQDDRLQSRHRAARADGGAIDVRRREPARRKPHRITRMRHRAHVPEHPHLQGDDAARKRGRRHARAPRLRRRRAAVRAARLSRARASARASGRTSCCRGSGSTTRPTTSPTTCRMASSASSNSPARWRPSRRLLLLDEPVAGMNPAEKAELMGEIAADRRARLHDLPDRARHALRDGPVRADRGAQFRPHHRRGHARRDPAQPGRDRSLSGSRGRRRSRVRSDA